MLDPDYERVDYTGWEFISRPEYDWSGRTVTGACFSQENPDTVVFAPDTTGVTFVHCNLDNVLLPDGCKTVNCSQRRFEVQNDLRDWEIDHTDEPVKVVNEKYWRLQGCSIRPEDIPADKLDNPDNKDLVALLKDAGLTIDVSDMLDAKGLV